MPEKDLRDIRWRREPNYEAILPLGVCGQLERAVLNELAVTVDQKSHRWSMRQVVQRPAFEAEKRIAGATKRHRRREAQHGVARPDIRDELLRDTIRALEDEE